MIKFYSLKRKNNEKILSIAALAALLGGCMPSRDHLASSVVSPAPDWIKYLENDGTVGNIAFFSENFERNLRAKKTAISSVWRS